MASKRKLRRRIEDLEDALALRAEMDRLRDVPSSAFMPLEGYVIKGGSTTLAPWCGICQGHHIPGQGACRATYSWTSLSTVVS